MGKIFIQTDPLDFKKMHQCVDFKRNIKKDTEK